MSKVDPRATFILVFSACCTALWGVCAWNTDYQPLRGLFVIATVFFVGMTAVGCALVWEEVRK